MKRVLLIFAVNMLNYSAFCQLCPANAGADRILCTAGSATLGTSGTSGHVYLWTPSTGLDNPHIAQPVATPSTTTTYTLTVSGRGCTTHSDQVTVNINDGHIYSVTPGGLIRASDYIDFYYQYEGSDFITLTSNCPAAHIDWYGFISGVPTYLSTGTSLTYTQSGYNTISSPLYFIYTYDDQGFRCSVDDQDFIQVTGHGCNSNSQYPVAVHNWFCSPDLPATITQPAMSTTSGNSPIYLWYLANTPTAWTFSGISGNTAQLAPPSGCPSYPGCYDEAYTIALDGHFSGHDFSPNEIRMRWAVGQYPSCPAPFIAQHIDTTAQSNYVVNKTSIFPNPAANQVTISCKNLIQRIEFYNSVGALIKSAKGNDNNSITIAINNLVTGVYTCKIFSDNGIEALKLIVSR